MKTSFGPLRAALALPLLGALGACTDPQPRLTLWLASRANEQNLELREVEPPPF